MVVVKVLIHMNKIITVLLEYFNSSHFIYYNSLISKHFKTYTINFTHVSLCHAIKPSHRELKDGWHVQDATINWKASFSRSVVPDIISLISVCAGWFPPSPHSHCQPL